MIGALMPLKPNTNPEMTNESTPIIAKIIDIENRRVIYLLSRILHRLTGLVSNNLIEPNECSEETRSLAITITSNGINIGTGIFNEHPNKCRCPWFGWIDIMIEIVLLLF